MLKIQDKKEIEERGLYDFVVNNYYKMTQADLKDLFKEFIYSVYSTDKDVHDEAVKLMFEELEFDKEEVKE